MCERVHTSSSSLSSLLSSSIAKMPCCCNHSSSCFFLPHFLLILTTVVSSIIFRLKSSLSLLTKGTCREHILIIPLNMFHRQLLCHNMCPKSFLSLNFFCRSSFLTYFFQYMFVCFNFHPAGFCHSHIHISSCFFFYLFIVIKIIFYIIILFISLFLLFIERGLQLSHLYSRTLYWSTDYKNHEIVLKSKI